MLLSRLTGLLVPPDLREHHRELRHALSRLRSRTSALLRSAEPRVSSATLTERAL